MMARRRPQLKQAGRVSAACVGLALLCALWPAHAAPAATNKGPLAVVVHRSNPISNLSSSALREIFLKRKERWKDGKIVMVINWKARLAPRIAFDQALLRLSPERAAAHWINRRIRGQGMPPASFKSHLIIRAIVSRHPEAISYLPLAAVTPSLKVVKIDGLSPEAAAYPIRFKR